MSTCMFFSSPTIASILTILRLLATYHYILCRADFVGALPVVLAAETSVWKEQRDADIDKSAAPSMTLSKRIFSGVREATQAVFYGRWL